MKCSNCHSLLSPLILLPHHNYNKHLIWKIRKPPILQVKGNGYSFAMYLKCSKLGVGPSHILLATTSLPTAKVSVLLQTSALCLTAYWVANFVVPKFILKDLEPNKTGNDTKNPAEDEQ